MYRYVLTLLSAFVTVSGLFAQQDYTSKIVSESGEKWWGLSVDNTLAEPFSEPFEISSSQLTPQQFGVSMLISTNGRYIWSQYPMTVKFDGENFTITSQQEKVEAQKGGKTLREAYLVCRHKYLQPSDDIQPASLFTEPIYMLSRMHNVDELESFMDSIVDKGLPKGTILIPDGWQSSVSNYQFDTSLYPDVANLINNIHMRGFRVMLTVTPYIAAAGRGYVKARSENALINGASGKPLVFEGDSGYSACLDINTDNAAQMNSCLKELQNEYKIDGFYLDCIDAIAHLQADPVRMNLFLQAWSEVGRGIKSVIFSPSVNPVESSAASAIVVTGEPSWGNLSKALGKAIGAETLGYSYLAIVPQSSSSQIDNNLILKATQLSAMMPAAIIPHSIWESDAAEQIDDILLWREKMAPYIESLIKESYTTAEPVLRNMEYQFPRSGFANCDDQFMLGEKYLMAPSVNDSDTRMVRLPKGTWKDMNGKTFRGPRVMSVDITNGKTAIFELQK